MNPKDYLKSPLGFATLVGSGFLWAWLDGLFMGSLFAAKTTGSAMHEEGMILTFSCASMVYALALASRRTFERRLRTKAAVLSAAFLGTIGSFFYIGAGIADNYAILAAGAIATGIFVACMQIEWGLVYCRDGARSAAPLVAGSFACALIVDIPLLFMIPQAQSVFFALAPLVSGACLARIVDKNPPLLANETLEAEKPGQAQRFFRRYLGISTVLLFALVLVMTGFGYLQHYISFSAPAEGVVSGAVIIQTVRGATALLLFVALVIRPSYASGIYRFGFLTMIAGVMSMSFTFGSEWLPASGALIISGYTVFDLFIWVAFSHIARTRSKNAFKTCAAMRLFASLCAAVGCTVAVFLDILAPDLRLATQEATFVGYLIVIATVLLVSNDDIRVLFQSAQIPLPASPPVPEMNFEERIDRWGDDMKMTAREKEIASLLIQGRTQPRIAELLGISENTVGTHVRHIYQKTSVHDKQQFIDLAISSTSPEIHDGGGSLTRSC